jgi:hypothetical protein
MLMQRAFESPPTQLTVNQAAGIAVSAAAAAAAVQPAKARHARTSLPHHLQHDRSRFCYSLRQKLLYIDSERTGLLGQPGQAPGSAAGELQQPDGREVDKVSKEGTWVKQEEGSQSHMKLVQLSAASSCT